jgi:protein SCO1/2
MKNSIILFMKKMENNFYKIKTTYSFLVVVLITAFLSGCKDELPVEKDISKYRFELLNEDSSKVYFPEIVKGKITVLGYIYTNCPDICPMTTNNMEKIEQKLKEMNIDNVTFISLSFDPLRDTPSILKQYAAIRDINLSNWHFLTGKENTIDSIKKQMNFFAVAEDTSYSADNKPYYFFTHTDRISLIDQSGRLRKNYKGSNINIEEIVNDIKSLGG